MSLIVVDVESDGEIPYRNSMVCFGAVIVENGLNKTFYGKTKPVSGIWNPEALKISGFSREDHMKFDDPFEVMSKFNNWISKNSSGRPVFISDNLAYDWQWINYYFHTYLNRNPFGFSGRRIGDLYCGMKMDGSKNREWKQKLRKTNHDHNPVNDAIGNAEAILSMRKMGLHI